MTFKQGKAGGVRFAVRLQRVLELWAHYVLTLNVNVQHTKVHAELNNSPYFFFYLELIQSDKHRHLRDENYLK